MSEILRKIRFVLPDGREADIDVSQWVYERINEVYSGLNSFSRNVRTLETKVSALEDKDIELNAKITSLQSSVNGMSSTIFGSSNWAILSSKVNSNVIAIQKLGERHNEEIAALQDLIFPVLKDRAVSELRAVGCSDEAIEEVYEYWDERFLPATFDGFEHKFNRLIDELGYSADDALLCLAVVPELTDDDIDISAQVRQSWAGMVNEQTGILSLQNALKDNSTCIIPPQIPEGAVVKIFDSAFQSSVVKFLPAYDYSEATSIISLCYFAERLRRFPSINAPKAQKVNWVMCMTNDVRWVGDIVADNATETTGTFANLGRAVKESTPPGLRPILVKRLPRVVRFPNSLRSAQMFGGSVIGDWVEVLDFPKSTHSPSSIHLTQVTKLPDIFNIPLAKNWTQALFWRTTKIKFFRNNPDTSCCTNFSEMFECWPAPGTSSSLEEVVLDLSSATNLTDMFYACDKLTDLFLTGLGTQENCTDLVVSDSPWENGVEESLLTNSFDRAKAGYEPMGVTLSASTYESLSDEDKAAITAKGFTLKC